MPAKGEKTLVTLIEDRIIAARALLAENRTTAADSELAAALALSKRVDKREVRPDPSTRVSRPRRRIRK